MTKLTRRQFLSLGAVFAAQFLTPTWVKAYDETDDVFTTPSRPFGRVIGWSQGLFRAPNHASKLEGYIGINSIIPLIYQVLGTESNARNPYWYRTNGGFVHSAWIQPVENTPNPDVVTEIPEDGLWSEVCMPLVRGHSLPDEDSTPLRLMYYETTYRVVDVEKSGSGQWWYRITDGYTWGNQQIWVPSTALRILHPEDLTPLSPGADKHIIIRIYEQDLTCYESGHAVYTTGIASGLPATATPLGEFTVQYKRHTRRMVGDDYDLLGVPFPVYINNNGVAIHGTYWHNDFVRRHSHGCVNVPSEAAKWIFRWVEPVAEYKLETQLAENGNGTPVTVI